MKVTLLGHASVLVEMTGATCLMDPVFFDPFEEGAVCSCPARVVYPERLPGVDVLIVSHRHPDHFDIASLDCVRRGCEVICPADPLIIYGLRRLGFERIHPVEPMGEISGADFELYPTRSEAPVREFGMVFKDGSGVFFNQVDGPLSTETIDTVRARFGRPDLMFAMYASQNFDFFENQRALFPYETHCRNLDTVVRMRPRMVVPGSAGFRFCGENAWLNAFLFPISARRFAADVRALDPEIETGVAMPADVFEISGEKVCYMPRASTVAQLKEDDSHLIDFDPTAAVPPLADPNPDAYSASELEKITRHFIAEQLAAFAFGPDAAGDPVVRAHRQHRAQYAVGVVLPGRATRWYRFDFASEPGGFSTSDGPGASSDLVHRVAASALCGWIARRKSFFYVRAYSRRFTTLYRLERAGDAARVTPVAIPDLLMHFLLNVAPGSATAARRHIDLELEALARRKGMPATS